MERESGGNINSRQMRRLGASVDWCRERFTMDEGLSEAVKEVFVQTYIMKVLFIEESDLLTGIQILYCRFRFRSESEEENGYLWHIRYPI